MREKRLRLVVTFHTTSGAIAAEQLCKKMGFDGKLISVPRCLTSDCGIAWSAEPNTQETLEQHFREAGIDAAGYHQVLI